MYGLPGTCNYYFEGVNSYSLRMANTEEVLIMEGLPRCAIKEIRCILVRTAEHEADTQRRRQAGRDQSNVATSSEVLSLAVTRNQDQILL